MKQYKQALCEAEDAVKDVADTELRKIGFEVILKQLLHTEEAIVASPTGATKASAPKTPTAPTSTNNTGLTADELSTLFEVRDDTIALKVRPTGASVNEQQQLLAHAVLLGYKVLLGQDTISAVKLAGVAKEWNLLDTNFGRKIQVPGLIQSKGKRRGVTYSFRPGAVAKLKETMQKMARGE